MLKKLRLNRRGLSPIFATLIILAVVTVLFIPVFIWASALTSSTKDSWNSEGTAARERIIIEAVSLTSETPPPAQSCSIYVRNIGETAVTINDVIISLPDGSAVHTYEKKPSGTELLTYDPEPTTPPKSLDSIIKGELIRIDIPDLACKDSSFQITADHAYLVKVFTTRGASDSYEVVA